MVIWFFFVCLCGHLECFLPQSCPGWLLGSTYSDEFTVLLKNEVFLLSFARSSLTGTRLSIDVKPSHDGAFQNAYKQMMLPLASFTLELARNSFNQGPSLVGRNHSRSIRSGNWGNRSFRQPYIAFAHWRAWYISSAWIKTILQMPTMAVMVVHLMRQKIFFIYL